MSDTWERVQLASASVPFRVKTAAVWVVLFTVVVPTSPRRALVAALTSVSSVPVIIGLVLASGAVSGRMEPAQFFFGLVFPYILIVGMAYVGARVVYQLGSEVGAGEL